MDTTAARRWLTIAALGACSGCGAARANEFSSLRLAVVPCGENKEGGTTILARDAAMIDNDVVVVGEARGAFMAGARRVRCPSSKATIVVSVGADGTARFATCIESSRGFPALIPLASGFAIVGHVSPGALPETPVANDATPRADPSAPGVDEVALYRFDRYGRLMARTILFEDSMRAGQVSATAANDGSIFVGVSVASQHDRSPIPQSVEDRLVRVDVRGIRSDLGSRTRPYAEMTPPISTMVALRSGGIARVLYVGGAIEITGIGADGAPIWKAREPIEGGLIDLDAAAQGDDVIVAWSSRIGHGEPAVWRRRLALVGATGSLASRSLGHEDVNAHVYGVIARGDHGAAVLFQVWPDEPQEFEGVHVTEAAVVVLGYDFDRTRPPTRLATLDGDITALGFRGSPRAATIAGWFHSRLDSRAPEPFGCGAFAAIAPRR